MPKKNKKSKYSLQKKPYYLALSTQNQVPDLEDIVTYKESDPADIEKEMFFSK